MTTVDEKKRILIVDDAPENIDVLNGILRQDYKIIAATNGEKALQIARNKPAPDIILLDIMMPNMDGYEVCSRLKKEDETKDIPVIFVTTRDEDADEIKGFSLGAVDYITKPVRPAIVRARVKNHLELFAARESLKQQNAVLAENIRLRDDVERITHHDLKNPLNAILSIPKLLIEDKNLSTEQIDMLRMIEASGYRMLDIINSSLDLYKMETGSYKVRLVPVNLFEVITQIQSDMQHLVKANNLSIQILLDGRAVTDTAARFIVHGDKMLFYSLLANLIKNAIEASPANETVQISFDSKEGRQIAIQNKGVVPEDIRDKFFEKYATAGKEGGTGLGTYTAALITKTLGGTIRFESNQDIGTAIHITLPDVALAQDADKPLPKGTSGAVSFDDIVGTLRVLVVDDYAPMRRTVVGILRQFGFSGILQCSDGAAALKILDEEEVDIVIADLHMPQVDGFELLRNIRSVPEWKDTPFIMMTGDSDLQTVSQAAKNKVSGFLIKPFSSNIMKEKIQTVINRFILR